MSFKDLVNVGGESGEPGLGNTSNLAAVVTSPVVFLAKHLYTPLSASHTAVNSNEQTPLLLDWRIFAEYTTGWSSFSHLIDGSKNKTNLI